MMKSLLIIFVTLATTSCQIHTKLHADGYHYDRPQNRLNVPEVKLTTQAPVTQRAIPVIPQTLPPLPAFIPRINLPSVIPVKPTNAPQQKRPIPPFPPIINLPSIIPVRTTQAAIIKPVTTQAPFVPVVEVSKPAPFVPRSQVTEATNEYLPPVEEDQEDEWEAWKKKYNKRYASQDEDDRRRVIFYENVNAINLHNVEYAAGRVTFDMDKNKFCDLLTDEFVQIHTGIRAKKAAHPGYDYPVPSGESYVSQEIGRKITFASQDGTSKTSISYQASKDGSSISAQSSSSSLPISPKSSSLPVSPKEFASSGQGQQSNNMTNVFMPSPMLADQTDDEVDWRKKGAVTPVKNQGKCASCWAFSANGAIEAQNFLRKGTGPIPLSEQNLIDCTKDNDGCDGGYMTNAYEYVRRNKGVDTESSYPYEEKDGLQCRFKRANVGGEVTTFMEIQEGNEEALRQAVATVGPVAAGIDGAKRSFQFYKSGYYYEPKCEQDVNHAVLIVGYGKTDKGEEYWIGKNSWDTDWGEAGYVRMAKNRNNHCGISNLASYPLV